MSFKIELGSTVKSVNTGFTGIVESRSEHLNGCNRYFIQPKVDKEGKLHDGHWLDEMELKVTAKPKVKSKKKDTGGPMSKIK